MKFRSLRSRLACAAVSVCLLAGTTAAEPVAQATGPQQIEPGNLLVLQVAGGPSSWIIMPHSGPTYSLYVASVKDGQVDIAVHTLPVGDGGDDPDDPPDKTTLADRVKAWAAEIDDAENRQKLSAAYQASVQLIDSGSVTTVDQLLALQKLANTTLLGDAATEWVPFFAKLSNYLDANTPADLAGYREAWTQIAKGLQ